MAGQHTENREAEFSRAVTQFAAEHWVSGRVVASEAGDAASSLGELMTLPSPFVDGAASSDRIVAWMDQAAAADVVVLDFGSLEPDAGIEAAALRTDRRPGGWSSRPAATPARPTYPAWVPDVLAVGAARRAGKPEPYSPYFPDASKPELYAPSRRRRAR